MYHFKIRKQKLAFRCEICHKTDCFDPINNYCSRCNPLFSAFITDSFSLNITLLTPKYFNYQPNSSFGWLSYVVSGFLLTIIIFAIAIPNFGTKCKSFGASAKETLRLIHSVQATYYAGIGKGQFATAEELVQTQLIDSTLADACRSKAKPKSGYYFQITPIKQSNGKDAAFTAIAISINTEVNSRNFYVDETGVIRYCKAPVIPNSISTPLGN